MQNPNCVPNLSQRQKTIVQVIVDREVYLRNGRGRRYFLSIHAIERFVERFNITDMCKLNEAWKQIAEAFCNIGHTITAEKNGGLKDTFNGITFVMDDTNYIIKTIYKAA